MNGMDYVFYQANSKALDVTHRIHIFALIFLVTLCSDASIIVICSVGNRQEFQNKNVSLLLS